VLQGNVHQHLRVHPGDEHLRGDLQGDAVKLPLSQDIGDGLALQAARQVLFQRLLIGPVRVVLVPVPDELLLRAVARRRRQEPGL